MSALTLVCAPLPNRTGASRLSIETPLRADGALRRVPIGSCRFVKGGVPPFTLSPLIRRAANKFAAINFYGRERRPVAV